MSDEVKVPESVERALQELHADDAERGPCSSMIKVRRAVSAALLRAEIRGHERECSACGDERIFELTGVCLERIQLCAQADALEAGND